MENEVKKAAAKTQKVVVGKSWKTTVLAGILGLNMLWPEVGQVLTQLTHAFDGDAATLVDWSLVNWENIKMGFGVAFLGRIMRDGNVSSQDHGIRSEG